jgi:hypothetical protein
LANREYKIAEQEGRGKPPQAPRVFPRPSRTHPTPFLFPSTVQEEKSIAPVCETSLDCSSATNRRILPPSSIPPWTVRGSGKRVEGVRVEGFASTGRREKHLGALWGVSRLPCSAIDSSKKFAEESPNQSHPRSRENEFFLNFTSNSLLSVLRASAVEFCFLIRRNSCPS